MADFTIKQEDTSPTIKAILKKRNGDAVNLTDASVRFHLSTRALEILIDSVATILDAPNGTVKYDWAIGDTDEPGEYFAEWEVAFSDGTVETFPNDGFILIAVMRQLA